jgi:dTDP-4-amino-4,6-dideoxygalactose transaminase
MTNRNIPLMKVHMPTAVDAAVLETLHSGMIATGKKTDAFEIELQKYLQLPVAPIATNSGTAAMLLALHLVGVTTGDEVIMTPLTCASMTESVYSTGAKIVWADINPTTGNIDPADAAKKVTKKTKVITYSHWCGRLADITALQKIAEANGLTLIEDAASALGGVYDGKPVGNHAPFTVLSFQAVKQITTGDGGALCVKDGAMRQRAILMRNHGNDRFAKRTPTTLGFDVKELGWRFGMNDISASIGLVQMVELPDTIKKIQNNLAQYNHELTGVTDLTLLTENVGATSAPYVFTVRVKRRDDFIKKMAEAGIGCGIVHERNDQFTLFESFTTPLPALDTFSQEYINLPLGFWVTSKDIKYICDTIKKGW